MPRIIKRQLGDAAILKEIIKILKKGVLTINSLNYNPELTLNKISTKKPNFNTRKI